MVIAVSVGEVTPIEVNIPVNILDRCTGSAIETSTYPLAYTHGCDPIDTKSIVLSDYVVDIVSQDPTYANRCTDYLKYALVTTSLPQLSGL